VENVRIRLSNHSNPGAPAPEPTRIRQACRGRLKGALQRDCIILAGRHIGLLRTSEWLLVIYFALVAARARRSGTGPAVILADGQMEWYRNGQLHREDGPAVIFADGTVKWLRHGKEHRDDAPR